MVVRGRPYSWFNIALRVASRDGLDAFVFRPRFLPVCLPCNKDHLKATYDRKRTAPGRSPSGYTSWIYLREGRANTLCPAWDPICKYAAAILREDTPMLPDKREYI